MTMIDLKKKLIIKINSIDNSLLLEELLRLAEVNDEGGDIYYLSAEQKTAVDKAQEQYLKGEYLCKNEANKEIDEWLGKPWNFFVNIH